MFLPFASLDDLSSSLILHVVEFGGKATFVPVVSPLLSGATFSSLGDAFSLMHLWPSEHLDNAFETQEAAFEEDPLRLYIRAVSPAVLSLRG